MKAWWVTIIIMLQCLKQGVWLPQRHSHSCTGTMVAAFRPTVATSRIRQRVGTRPTTMMATTTATSGGDTDSQATLQKEEDDANVHRRSSSLKIFYNDVYEVPLPPNHRFPMAKYRQTRELLQQWITAADNKHSNTATNNSNLETSIVEFQVSPLATVAELETTHCPLYIQRYLNGDMTADEQRNVGFPWSKESVDRSLSSTGGTVAAACHVLDQKRQQQQQQQIQQSPSERQPRPALHWAAHVAAGTHHAFYNRGEGFSVFSDMAVAANVVLERYADVVQRILFIDLDVHQGNGNAVLFQNKPQVFTFSVHCRANYFSQKERSDLDIELPAGCDDATYLMTLHHWLKQLLCPSKQDRRDTTTATTTPNKNGSRPPFDLILFQAGVDVLEQDRLGRMSLSAQGVKRRNQMVYDFSSKLDIPLVVTMGGGYPRGDDWTPILEAHASVYYQAYQHLKRHDQRPETTLQD